MVGRHKVLNRLKKIIEKRIGGETVILDDGDVEAIMSAVLMLEGRKIDRDKINEVVAQYYDGNISGDQMAVMVSHAVNIDR